MNDKHESDAAIRMLVKACDQYLEIACPDPWNDERSDEPKRNEAFEQLRSAAEEAQELYEGRDSDEPQPSVCRRAIEKLLDGVDIYDAYGVQDALLSSIRECIGVILPHESERAKDYAGPGPLVVKVPKEPARESRPRSIDSREATNSRKMTPHEADRQSIAERAIADLRRRLLDLRNSNRLLNFRFSDRARTHVRVVHELPDVLYSKLQEGKKLVFKALPEPEDEPKDEKSDTFLMALKASRMSDEDYLRAVEALEEGDETSAKGQEAERALKDRVRDQLGLPPRPASASITAPDVARAMGIEPSYDLPRSEGDGADRAAHRDDFIQTLLFPDQMERKLAGCRDGAQAALSEMGLNILYAAFGYLEWYESSAGDRPLLAPLILHPLEMDRVLIRQKYRYSIGSTGEESEINLTLKERLLGDFSLLLPDLLEEDTPDSYFDKAEDAIKDMKRWRVRRFVTAGLFAFGRLAMYHDLDPKRWPAEKSMDHHAVVVDLLGGSDRNEGLHAEEYESDRPEIAAKVPLLVTEADASQFSAIVDVMEGKNLAIKGPPGTGKSQTITNIIAAGLAKGLKVLFVAEKMAALDVVKKRLDDAGLGAFCLELHSTKARKKDVLESLRMRLELAYVPQPSGFEGVIEECERLREELSGYATTINQKYGNTGRSLQQLLWAATKARMHVQKLGLPADLDEVMIGNADHLTSEDLDRLKASLTDLERVMSSFVDAYGHPEKHPWAGYRHATLSPFEQQDVIKATGAWHAAAMALDHELALSSEELSVPSPVTLRDARRLIRTLALLREESGSVVLEILPSLDDEGAVRRLEEFLRRMDSWMSLKGDLERKLDDPDGCIPTCKLLLSVATECEELKVDGHAFFGTVGSYQALAQRYLDRAGSASSQVAVARRLLGTAGVTTAPTVIALEVLLDALDFLRSTPRRILSSRTVTLLDEAYTSILETAALEAKELRKRRTELVELFSFSTNDSQEQHRKCAATLRSATLLQRLLGKEYRRARASWRRARKIRINKTTPGRMAEDLEAIADYLESLGRFNGNTQLQVICGINVGGIDTDFDLLTCVNQYGATVKSRFGGPGSGEREARRLLLMADMGTVDGVLEEIDDRILAGLREFVSAAKGEGGGALVHVELSAVESAYRQVAEAATGIHSTLKGAGIRDDVQAREIRVVADTVASLLSIGEVIDQDEVVANVLGSRFRGTHTDTQKLDRTAHLARQLLADGLRPKALRSFVSEGLLLRLANLGERLERAGKALEAYEAVFQTAIKVGQIDSGVFLSVEDPVEATLESIRLRIDRALAHPDELPAWMEQVLLRRQVEELQLAPILEAYERNGKILSHLDIAFEHVIYRSILRRSYQLYPNLGRFSGTKHGAARARFQALDRKIVFLHRRRLAAQLSDAPISRGTNWGPKHEWTDSHLIQHEIGKKKRHIPLRDLLLRAGSAIQDMKPCWMMSPPSVAKYVRPAGAEFDLVVIDEASQMRPEEALGAIGRGRQLVVVGDPQQLPPTSFFERIDLPDENEEEAEDVVDNESILDRALSVFSPARNLRWHYRSRHESLIAFSNKHFYEGKLVLFPSALSQHGDYGVHYVKVDGIYTPKASVNVTEAKLVGEEAVQFMARYPNRSLGIVTMNQGQREILREEMDRLFARNPGAEAYRKRWENTLEPFIVKNLENIQGDERDVIFISTVYGPEQRGGRVAQRFGPINAAAGHRRLNVLFTRAKEKVELFSSMSPSDVIPTETSRPGVGVLKHYLAYAKSGALELGTSSGREPDSDFEVFVADRLRQQGFVVVSQVGVAGYFVDLGVKHPREPDRFILGIECDGATYHSAKSTRDRDRLREEILIQRGWEMYRVWSTDWFNDPEREFKKLFGHIQTLSRS